MQHRDKGKEIVATIRADETINKLIGGRIIPVVSTDPVKTPYIAYRRASTEFAEYKQFSRAKSVDMEIAVITDDYGTGVEIANLLDDLFPKKVDSDEGFFDGVGYVQKLIVKIKM
ncbi:MAG: hypothetical protein RR382_02715 [Tannerellaceae bacterium]